MGAMKQGGLVDSEMLSASGHKTGWQQVVGDSVQMAVQCIVQGFQLSTKEPPRRHSQDCISKSRGMRK